MTAVEWLQDRLPSLFEHDDNGFYKNMFEQAKELERNQIIEAAIHDISFPNSPYRRELGENYYTKTYQK